MSLFKKIEPIKETESAALTGDRTKYTMKATDVITGKESTEVVKSSVRQPRQ
jgi:hypothetical protein